MNMKLCIYNNKLFLFSLLILGILSVFPSCQYETVPATKGIHIEGEKY